MEFSEQELADFSAQEQQRLARVRRVSFTLSALLLAASIAWLAYTVVQVNKLNADVEHKQEDLKTVADYLYESLASLESEMDFSEAPDNIKIILATELGVDTSRTERIPETIDPRWEYIEVQYFPKEKDRDKVEAALTNLKVSAITGVGNPALSRIPTNAVWYGRDVDPELVKQLAIALIEEGLEIKSLKPGSSRFKANRIQIGTLSSVIDDEPLTPAYVQNMDFGVYSPVERGAEEE